jgi:hypothetical protein
MRFGGLDDGRNGTGGKTAHGDPIRLAMNPSPGWPPRVRSRTRRAPPPGCSAAGCPPTSLPAIRARPTTLPCRVSRLPTGGCRRDPAALWRLGSSGC